MARVWRVLMVVLVWPAVMVFAQQAQEAPKDVLLAKQSIVLPWIIGIGILVVTVIAGFKHPGRTHLD